MLAWMDEEALRRTRESGEAWFWSRSRQEYWHKGATSGNTLAIVEIRDDCAATRSSCASIRPALPATPAPSRALPLALARRRRARRDPAGGLVRRRPARAGHRRGRPESGGGRRRGCARRGRDSDERLVEELADLWFHSYVLLAARGLDPERVEEELRRRHRNTG